MTKEQIDRNIKRLTRNTMEYNNKLSDIENTYWDVRMPKHIKDEYNSLYAKYIADQEELEKLAKLKEW